MDFEELLTSLNKKGMLIHHLSQLKDGKVWSASVRKKGTTKVGHGYGKGFQSAIKEALASMRDSMSEKDFKKASAVRNPVKVKKKRVRIKGR